MKAVRSIAEHRLTPAVAHRLVADDRRIVVTGAGGWLGLATLDLLHNALGDAFGQRVVCFGSAMRTLQLSNGVSIVQHPLSTLPALGRSPTLLFHMAFLGKDRAENMEPDTYRDANRALSRCVLDALDPVGVDAVFLSSSGAARYEQDVKAAPAMRLYGGLKCEDERAFAAWAERAGTRCVIARLFNLTGPYINKHNVYALASFIADALNGCPVTVRATRPVLRSYVAIRELMSVVLSLVLTGSGSTGPFDTAGEETLEMRQIARYVADLVGDGRVEAASIAPGESEDRYVGDGTLYREFIRSSGIETVDFQNQILESAAYMATLAR